MAAAGSPTAAPRGKEGADVLLQPHAVVLPERLQRARWAAFLAATTPGGSQRPPLLVAADAEHALRAMGELCCREGARVLLFAPHGRGSHARTAADSAADEVAAPWPGPQAREALAALQPDGAGELGAAVPLGAAQQDARSLLCAALANGVEQQMRNFGYRRFGEEYTRADHMAPTGGATSTASTGTPTAIATADYAPELLCTTQIPASPPASVGFHVRFVLVGGALACAYRAGDAAEPAPRGAPAPGDRVLLSPGGRVATVRACWPADVLALRRGEERAKQPVRPRNDSGEGAVAAPQGCGAPLAGMDVPISDHLEVEVGEGAAAVRVLCGLDEVVAIERAAAKRDEAQPQPRRSKTAQPSAASKRPPLHPAASERAKRQLLEQGRQQQAPSALESSPPLPQPQTPGGAASGASPPPAAAAHASLVAVATASEAEAAAPEAETAVAPASLPPDFEYPPWFFVAADAAGVAPAMPHPAIDSEHGGGGGGSGGGVERPASSYAYGAVAPPMPSPNATRARERDEGAAKPKTAERRAAEGGYTLAGRVREPLPCASAEGGTADATDTSPSLSPEAVLATTACAREALIEAAEAHQQHHAAGMASSPAECTAATSCEKSLPAAAVLRLLSYQAVVPLPGERWPCNADTLLTPPPALVRPVRDTFDGLVVPSTSEAFAAASWLLAAPLARVLPPADGEALQRVHLAPVSDLQPSPSIAGGVRVWRGAEAAARAGYQDDWLDTPVAGLGMWEALPLEPYAAPKDVRYVCVAPGAGQAAERARTRLRAYGVQVSAMYTSCGLGACAPAVCDVVARDHPAVAMSDACADARAALDAPRAVLPRVPARREVDACFVAVPSAGAAGVAEDAVRAALAALPPASGDSAAPAVCFVPCDESDDGVASGVSAADLVRSSGAARAAALALYARARRAPLQGKLLTADTALRFEAPYVSAGAMGGGEHILCCVARTPRRRDLVAVVGRADGSSLEPLLRPQDGGDPRSEAVLVLSRCAALRRRGADAPFDRVAICLLGEGVLTRDEARVWSEEIAKFQRVQVEDRLRDTHRWAVLLAFRPEQATVWQLVAGASAATAEGDARGGGADGAPIDQGSAGNRCTVVATDHESFVCVDGASTALCVGTLAPPADEHEQRAFGSAVQAIAGACAFTRASDRYVLGVATSASASACCDDGGCIETGEPVPVPRVASAASRLVAALQELYGR